MSPEPAGPNQLLLTIVHGNPTPEELAAVIAVTGALASASAQSGPASSARSAWSHPSRMHRTPLAAAGPGTWVRASR